MKFSEKNGKVLHLGWKHPTVCTDWEVTCCQGAASASCSLREGEPGAKGDNTAEQGRGLTTQALPCSTQARQMVARFKQKLQIIRQVYAAEAGLSSSQETTSGTTPSLPFPSPPFIKGNKLKKGQQRATARTCAETWRNLVLLSLVKWKVSNCSLQLLLVGHHKGDGAKPFLVVPDDVTRKNGHQLWLG